MIGRHPQPFGGIISVELSLKRIEGGRQAE